MPDQPVNPSDDPAAELAEATAQEDRGVRAAAVLMIVTIFASAITGLISNAVIANKFGVGLEASTYWQAFRIPSFVYFLIAGGALRTGFIPVFTTYVQQGEQEKAWRTFSVALTVMMVVSTVVVGLGMALSGPLGRLMMSADQGAHAQEMCGNLMRVMFPAQIFFLIGGLMQGTLNAMRHFWGPAIGPIIYNIAIIIATLGFAKQFGLYAPSAGVVAGALLSTLPCCIPPLMRLGARYRPRFDLRDEGFRRVVALAAPIILGLAIAEVNLVITTALATRVADWGSAVLNNADRFAKLPMRMFGAGIAIAVYPTLAIHAAANDAKRFAEVLSGGVRNVMFLAVPSAFGLVALRDPIMRLIYQHGEVTAEGTHQMAVALAYLSAGILGMSALQVVARGFYALQDTKTPVVVGIFAVAVCVVLSFALMYRLQVAGLAIATSVSNLTNAGLLLWLLHRRMGEMDGRRLAGSFAKVMLASAALGIAAWLGALVTEHFMGTEGMTARLASVAVGMAAGAVVFLVASSALKIEEARTAFGPIARRLRR